MATSGSFVTNIITGSGVSRRLSFAWSAGTPNIAGNYTPISWTLKGDYSTGWMYGQNFYATVDEATTNSTTKRQVTNGLLIASGSKNIYHNSDGTKSFSASAGGELYNYGTPNSTGSGTWSLDAIPRVSTFTAPERFTIGSPFNVTINSASSGFKHYVRLYDINDAVFESGWVTPTTVSVTNNLNTLLDKCPNNAKAYKIRVYTQSGGVELGYNDRVIIGDVPSSIVPSFTTITHSDADATTKNTIGSYVQSKSRLQLAMTGGSAGRGATVSAYQISVDGQSLNASSGTTQAIRASGTVAIVGKITDSRGRTASKTVNVTVLAYSPPAITSVNFYRCNSAGVKDDYGTFAKFSMGYSITALGNKNGKAVKVQVGSNNTNTTPTDYSGTHTVQYSGFNVNSSYPISFYVADLYGSTASPQILPAGSVTMAWGADNVSIGTTQLKESGSLNVGGEVYSKNMALGSVYNPKSFSDLNSYTESGHFSLADIHPTNAPQHGLWGFLTVVRRSQNDTNSIVQNLTVHDGTVWVRTRWGEAWRPWIKLAKSTDLPNQSDYAFSSGSNSNGSWVKRADGTMTCKYTVNTASRVPASWGNVFYFPVPTWVFPQQFASRPVVTGSSTQYGWFGHQNVTVTQCINPQWITATNVALALAVELEANGRWK